jgi:ABC-type uncharacterized transport system substrate-binding protein
LNKYKNQQIDLMITFRTPPPNEFTTLFRTGLFKDIPVVYLLRDSERPDPNSTGVYYDLDVKKTLELALKLQPNTRRVFTVVGSSKVDKLDLPENGLNDKLGGEPGRSGARKSLFSDSRLPTGA